MMPHGGFSLSNLLQGHSLAILSIAMGILILLGVISVAFKGSIVI